MKTRAQILKVSEALSAAEREGRPHGGNDTPDATGECDSRNRPEWLRPNEVRHYFGLGRSTVYRLLAEGAIKSVSLRKRGQKHATRLICYENLKSYLESLAEGGEP